MTEDHYVKKIASNSTQSDVAVKVHDPREKTSTARITEYELNLIIEHHRRQMLTCAFEATALRQISVCGMMSAAHAADRLRELDEKVLKQVEVEIEATATAWNAIANTESEWEDIHQADFWARNLEGT